MLPDHEISRGVTKVYFNIEYIFSSKACMREHTVHDELRDVLYVNMKHVILTCQTNPECKHSCFYCILYQCNKKLNLS